MIVGETSGLPQKLLTRIFAGAVFAALAVSADVAVANDPPLLKPESGPWDAGNGFSFQKDEKKTRRSLSGIACPMPSLANRICLVVFDEGIEARYVLIGKDAYKIDAENVVLRAGKGELDAEAAAADERYYYVTGSHSAKRKDCSNNPDSRHVIRFLFDPKTGRGLRDNNGKLAGYAESDTLWHIMESLPRLAAHVGDRKCLGTEPPEDASGLVGQRGVNVEGLAVKGGRAYFGFRGPADSGITKILSVDAEALFSGGDHKAALVDVRVGDRRGIRDFVAVKDGFLFLTGPDDDKASENAGWVISLWDGKAMGADVVKPKQLARLDLTAVALRQCDKELKPEALTVLEETAEHYRVVVLSDGMCDGGPLGFRISR